MVLVVLGAGCRSTQAGVRAALGCSDGSLTTGSCVLVGRAVTDTPSGLCLCPPPSPAPCRRLQNRYLIILYYNATRHKQKSSLKDQEAEVRRMQEKHGVDGEQHARAKK